MTTNEEPMTDSQRRLIMSLAINDLQTKTSRHENILITGINGQLPLLERVRNLEKYVENYVDTTKYWTRFVVGALILQTLSLGSAVAWAAVKLIPLIERLTKVP